MTTELSAQSPPWSESFSPLDRSRVAVVANTSSGSWSLSACTNYCQQRGIPQSNILSVNFGTTNGSWSPVNNAEVGSVFYTPLRTHLLAMSAQAVLMGPQTPDYVRITGIAPSASTDYMPLPSLAALAHGVPWSEMGGELRAYDFGSGSRIWLYPFSANGGSYNGPWGVSDLLGRDFASTMTLFTVPGHAGIIPSVLPAATSWLGDSTSKQIPVGRIGYQTFSGSASPVESEALVATRLTGALRASPPGHWAQAPAVGAGDNHLVWNSHQVALGKPLLFMFKDVVGGDTVMLASFSKLCADWGINRQYFYRPGVTESAYAPFSGQITTAIALMRDLPYYMLFGCGLNAGEMWDYPYTAAWLPLPGAGCMIGPSNGYHYAHMSLGRGAACAMLDYSHIVSSLYTRYLSVLYHLLRGMSWVEAGFYAGTHTQVIPSGDPLFVPYPTA